MLNFAFIYRNIESYVYLTILFAKVTKKAPTLYYIEVINIFVP